MDIYEKIPLFQLEEDYGKTEAGRTECTVGSSELLDFSLAFLHKGYFLSILLLRFFSSRDFVKRVKNSWNPRIYPCATTFN